MEFPNDKAARESGLMVIALDTARDAHLGLNDFIAAFSSYGFLPTMICSSATGIVHG